MDTQEAIKSRTSVREYTDKPIAKEALNSVVDAARFAPTARGVEPWEFIVITNQETLKKIGEIAENGKFVAGAAACIAVFCSETKYYLEDGCAATENMLIAATALGIGSCWVAGDKKPYCSRISELLNAPVSLKLVSLIALGYPESGKTAGIRQKRGLGEVMHWEKF
ncbi:MAG: nitroreductase [Omnitrophica WOR_2 bacterium RBG_13_44_8b]|nr:MAG: nitroreductase [Omnitrophica WOR_2 bacterium RBG_13_44_8b]